MKENKLERIHCDSEDAAADQEDKRIAFHPFLPTQMWRDKDEVGVANWSAEMLKPDENKG